MILLGAKPFPLSPRNSPEAIVHMLEKTDCHRMISHSLLAPLNAAVEAQLAAKNYPIQFEQLPSITTIFPAIKSKDPNDSPDAAVYPSDPNPYKLNDIVLYLHSSGSTGFPKPIPQTQKTILHWCCSRTRTSHSYSMFTVLTSWLSLSPYDLGERPWSILELFDASVVPHHGFLHATLSAIDEQPVHCSIHTSRTRPSSRAYTTQCPRDESNHEKHWVGCRSSFYRGSFLNPTERTWFPD